MGIAENKKVTIHYKLCIVKNVDKNQSNLLTLIFCINQITKILSFT